MEQRYLVTHDERNNFRAQERGSSFMIELEKLCNRYRAQYRIATNTGENMSNVTWCDPGNHAFKAGTPGSQSFNGSTVNADGEIVHMQMDACPDHSFQPTSEKTSTAIT